MFVPSSHYWGIFFRENALSVPFSSCFCSGILKNEHFPYVRMRVCVIMIFYGRES